MTFVFTNGVWVQCTPVFPEAPHFWLIYPGLVVVGVIFWFAGRAWSLDIKPKFPPSPGSPPPAQNRS